jgi:hypothetical protein
MKNVVRCGEVLEAAGNLPLENQGTLLRILQRRIIAHRREDLAKDIRQGQQEFLEGRCQLVEPAELMKDISALFSLAFGAKCSRRFAARVRGTP